MQIRAARTRGALIRGAAVCMDAQGFKGATLTAIAESCDVSIGALTFHFHDKTRLAAAVADAGASIAREAVEAASVQHESPLRAMEELLSVLTRLLAQDVVVRAAALLTRERADIAADWRDAWVPRLAELAEQADERGELGPGVEPCLVTDLVDCLVTAAEVRMRRAGHCRGAGGELARVWLLIRRGIASDKA
ncbi:TetR family transcriptional regulator [Streptomyces sp. NPDC102451]|uniref:TetR family transcriptional regulator n=1 Tax=Streptomyces sp. NPDC102451 TaxID=3366177 RepID=UPI003825D9A0